MRGKFRHKLDEELLHSTSGYVLFLNQTFLLGGVVFFVTIIMPKLLHLLLNHWGPVVIGIRSFMRYLFKRQGVFLNGKVNASKTQHLIVLRFQLPMED